jgi:predicted ArsR family transcriptional regulator
MTTSKPLIADAVINVLESKDGCTAAEIAEATGLGRSTVGKALARLAESERVRRRAGGREGARRVPDCWALAKRKRTRPASNSGRLRPKQLDGLALEYLNTQGGRGRSGGPRSRRAWGDRPGSSETVLSAWPVPTR